MEKWFNSSLKRMGIIYLLASHNADERLRTGSFWQDNRLILYSRLVECVARHYRSLNLSKWLHPQLDNEEFMSWLKAQEIEYQLKEEYIRIAYANSIDIKNGLYSYLVEPYVELPTVIYYSLPLSTVLYTLQRASHKFIFPNKHALLTYNDVNKEVEVLIKQSKIKEGD